MIRNVALIVSIFFSFIIAAALVRSFRAQSATDEKLAVLTKQLDEQKKTVPPVAAPVPQTIILPADASNLPTQYAQKEFRVQQVMDAGWKLINQRQKEPALHAAELFQAAIKDIDPRTPDLYNGLGRSLLISGSPREAIAAWRTGLSITPKFADMQSGIGWAYWHLNDPYHAQKAWEAAVAIDPKSPDAWSALAWIDLALGDAHTARNGFEALLAHDKNNTPWIMGLSMARANNADLAQIRLYFPIPDIAAFHSPPATDPADTVASAATATSQSLAN